MPIIQDLIRKMKDKRYNQKLEEELRELREEPEQESSLNFQKEKMEFFKDGI